MNDRIYRVDASALNMRSRPSTQSGVLTTLAGGQAVARLDDESHDGWWLVFADVPRDGIYVGFVFSRYLLPVGVSLSPAAEADLLGDMSFDDEDEHAREPRGAASSVHIDHEDAHASRAVWSGGWHPDIPDERRFDSPNQSDRRGDQQIKRIVIHITGTSSLSRVISSFTNPGASAHYLVDQEGLLYQFVPEHKKAWHSGIKSYIRRLYANRDGHWRKYKRYFDWHRGYPSNARFFDANMREVSEGPDAALVTRNDGREWSDYQYFDDRWGRRSTPLGFLADGGDPNNASIGIEILSVGSRSFDPGHYSSAMYRTLEDLVDTICARHSIPKTKDFIVGHEDVNPVERWGWDPNQGFEWDRVILGGHSVG